MELERRMEEMQGRIQEKITLLVSQSEEHKSLIERSSSTVAMFSEKVTSYEKEVKENSHSGAQDLDSFKQEVERKMLDLFDTTEDQSSQLEQLNISLASVMDQSNRTLEDVVGTQSELKGLKNIMLDDRELIVKRVAEQKESSETEVAGMIERFEKLESAQDQEVSLELIPLKNITIFVFTDIRATTGGQAHRVCCGAVCWTGGDSRTWDLKCLGFYLCCLGEGWPGGGVHQGAEQPRAGRGEDTH